MLFFDLVSVYVITQISGILEHVSVKSMLHAIIVLMLLFWQWVGVTI